MSTEQVAYWDKGVRNVPDMTGAKNVMQCQDLEAVAKALDIALPFYGPVLDVGCGTGRAHKVCAGDYFGVDIAPSMVEYAAREGLSAATISGPKSLAGLARYDTVLCISVFTHISRSERQAYLAAFAKLAPMLLVDILPGPEESGGIPAWYAEPGLFKADLTDAGYDLLGCHDLTWEGLYMHRYHWCRRQA